MEATSARQFETATGGGVPGLEAVRDDVWALGRPMPGERLGYSLLYLLRDADGRLHVVDPGTDSDDGPADLEGALKEIGAGLDDIATITATHLHPDHLGMAERLRAATGATLQLHEAEVGALGRQADERPTRADAEAAAERWGVPDDRIPELVALVDALPAHAGPAPRVDRLLTDGERLDVPGFDLRVLHTPGHTGGHLTLHDAVRGLAFTGDQGRQHVVAGLGRGGRTPTNALADYLASVERVVALGDVEALPGHGYRFTGLPERARASAEHHLRRTREVEALDPALSTWQTASRLTWTDGFATLEGFTLWSALTQTDMHRTYLAGRR